MICHKKFPVSPIGLNYFYTIGMNTNLWWCFITRCEHCLIFIFMSVYLLQLFKE